MPQYVPLGTVDAPASWTLPPSLQLQLEAAFAHYDGTSAAGAYLPCLKVVSDSGHTVGMYVASASVAAGSSVEATWGPFLKGAQAAASSGIAWAIQSLPSSTVTVAAGTHAEFGAATGTDTFHTNNAAVFSYAKNSSFNIYGIQVETVGHYMLFGQFAVTSFGAGAIDLAISLAAGPPLMSVSGFYGVGEILSSTPVYGDENANPTLTWIGAHHVTAGSGGAPADPLVWEVTNSGANTASLTAYGYTIFQLDAVDAF